MKSPAQLKQKLRRQWDQANMREARLLAGETAWPLILPIGKPSPGLLATDLDAVRQHIDAWRRVKIGELLWEPICYRAAAEPVSVPTSWKLSKPSEWIEACGEASVRQEFSTLSDIVAQTDPQFHPLLARRRSLWREKPVEEIVQAAQLALALNPGAAEGKPLRALSIGGNDTKLIERHTHLVTVLLDVRFDGEVSHLGLETFLGAAFETDRWLLVIDLDEGLLPFQKMRVRSSEVQETMLPGENLLLVENESSQHQLPKLGSTVAVLGSGFDLGWIAGSWLQSKRVGYWGDIDTWGLHFLASARDNLSHLDALLMSEQVYERYAAASVPEKVVAGEATPSGLNEAESSLYDRLLREQRGRLEQEFIPAEIVHEALCDWALGKA